MNIALGANVYIFKADEPQWLLDAVINSSHWNNWKRKSVISFVNLSMSLKPVILNKVFINIKMESRAANTHQHIYKIKLLYLHSLQKRLWKMAYNNISAKYLA